jgi:hypothetical protein
MRNIRLPWSIVVLAFTAFAHADDSSRTYDLTGKPELRVETHDANVRIESWDQNKIETHFGRAFGRCARLCPTRLFRAGARYFRHG